AHRRQGRRAVRWSARRERAVGAARGRAPVRRNGGEARDGQTVSTLTAPIAIRTSNLGAIRARGIPVPQYDRSRLVPRIVHVGVGGFHRAHMALYTDDVA